MLCRFYVDRSGSAGMAPVLLEAADQTEVRDPEK
jgi:hypothetical protein